MKFRTFLITGAFIITAASSAVAQNTLSPADPARPGLQGDDSSKPNGLQNNTGTGLPAGGEPVKHTHGATTGEGQVGNATGHFSPGPGTDPAHQTSDKNTSPASPNAGIKQIK